ncbi:polysaccharide pyruvyl transferase family protein [Bacteroides acidifaciens]|nr:polysaccharide pyruvyl transferase family protein [Bacteroides acidifaciens]
MRLIACWVGEKYEFIIHLSLLIMETSKRSVGILTFHASHNYGSMLQAHALQYVVVKLGYTCEIINFRKKEQLKMYAPIHKRGSLLQRLVRTVTLFPYLKGCNEKYRLFEEFMQQYMNLSPDIYHTLEDVEKAGLQYDYYITGSDQIWNPICWDFDWVYFLPFVEKGKKIAYAPSMGGMKDAIEADYIPKMKRYIESYDALSVRELGTVQKMSTFIDRDLKMVLDPTLLVDVEHWNEMIDPQPLVAGEYLFLYAPVFNLPTFEMVRRIADRLKLKVVISQLYGREITYKYRDFMIYAAVGPKEFLNLCKNARLVCGNSFHLIVFSILLKVPFLAVNGLSDNRISDLLHKTGLEGRAISNKNFDEAIGNAFSLTFEEAQQRLDEERKSSINYLMKSLNLI